jgi:hypothetical protein
MANPEKPKQKHMDETLEDSFPASDPPSWSTPHPEKELQVKKDETKGRPKEVHQDFSKSDFMPGTDTAKAEKSSKK